MLKLDQEVVNSTVGSYQKVFNDDVLEVFSGLAAALREEESNGGNAIITQTLESCRKFQGQYNTCLESFSKFVEDAKGVEAIAEYVKKASMGDVASRDTSFENQHINPDDVVM